MGPHLELTVNVFAAVLVILAATTVFGRLARTVGQPRVVGEMTAGVLLGPSLLGAVAPAVEAQLFPDDVKSVLYVLSTIGLTFYMFLVGAGIDHRFLDARRVRRSLVLAASGVIPAFLLGAGVGLLYHDQLSAPGVTRLEFALFIGGALSVTAFPMLARILDERGMGNTSFGSLVLLVAAVDDAVAWGLLAVITAIAGAGEPSAAVTTIVGGAAFTVAMLTFGRRLLQPLGRRVEREGRLTHESMALVLLLVIGAGWITDSIGIFSVFGGFITGLAMPHSRTLRRELQTRLADLNMIVLLPIFFAFSGLNTHLRGLEPELAVPLLVIVMAAVIGKYVGCGLTVRRQGLSWRHASAVGGLMNARGLMILVFINIGLAYDLLTTDVFALLVVIAVVSTAMALPIDRLSFPPWLEALEREQPPRSADGAVVDRDLQDAARRSTERREHNGHEERTSAAVSHDGLVMAGHRPDKEEQDA